MISPTADGRRPTADGGRPSRRCRLRPEPRAITTSHEPRATRQPSPPREGRPRWVLHPENRRGDERSGAEHLGDDEQGKRETARGRFVIGSLGLGFGFHFVSVDRCSPRSASRVLRERSLAISCARRTRQSPGLTPGLVAALHAVAGRVAISVAHAYGWRSMAFGRLVQPAGRDRTCARCTGPRPSTSTDSPGAQAAMSCVSARSRRRRTASAGRPSTAGMPSSNPR
jgi:hypothetical protein